MIYPGFESIEERDAFFQRVIAELRLLLPDRLKDFDDCSEVGKNFIRLRYKKQLKQSLYELQFVGDRSKAHKRLYGGGNKVVLSYYYGNTEKSSEWLTAIRKQQEEIERKVGNITIEKWSENWMTVGMILDAEALGLDVEIYAHKMACFIQATFEPVRKVAEDM